MKFYQIVDTLTSKVKSAKVSIKGKRRYIKGMVLLKTINMPESPYIKITFTDGSFLLLMLSETEAYFAETIVDHIKSIKDEQIGRDKTIEYRGKTYELGNKNDYQFVIQKFTGNFNDIEGEARFSDYFPVKGEKEFLSLGWLSYTRKRADINPIFIDLSEINVE